MVVSEALMVAPEARTMVFEDPRRAESLSCPIPEVLAPISVASHSDRVAVRQIGEDRWHKVDLTSPGQLEGMEIGPHSVVLSLDTISGSSNPLHRQQWMVSNQFFPLNHLGREGDLWFKMVEEVFSEVQS